MNCPDLIGQVLDGKYQMTRELGRGGMGAVYLATHLGTERPVAVKVIAPQFMERAEFVERFRREAGRRAFAASECRQCDGFWICRVKGRPGRVSRDGIPRRLHARRDT